MDSSSKEEDGCELDWTEYHMSVVRDYVSKFEPDLRALTFDKLLKQNLQKFFLVPKIFDTLKKIELVAAFINFLLQLLHEIKFFESVQEELKFLLMVLGDTFMVSYVEKQVQINLLAEVEAMANVAGSLVHSIIFSTYEDPECHTVEERYGVLLEQVALLKSNILKLSNMLPPFIAKYNNITNPKASSSLFIVDSLICDLKNLLNRKNSLIGEVKDSIDVLHYELMISWSLLKSIMVPPPPESEIQEMAFEVEYLIFSFLSGDAPLWYFSMRLPHVSHKIKLITKKLDELKIKYDIEALKVTENDFSTSQQLPSQAKNNYEIDDNIVVGFEESFITILNKLVQRPRSRQIIFIFGMPGLGKTTFAKILYNHPIVQMRFDRFSWCVVSQIYNRKRILTDIASSFFWLDKNKISNKDEESLSLMIHKSLCDSRYLIVIDDVWDVNILHYLLHSFPDHKNGSRILITSRNQDIAPQNSIRFELPYLSNEQCWELLEKKVFKDKPCPSELIGVGKEIATYCHGLPLAVVVAAGKLSTTTKEESAWKKVGEQVSSYSSRGENDSMMPIFELSYKDLPHYLKPCFLYFGVFPEDREISAKKLMQLWVAEGFIPKDEESLKNSDILAEEYFSMLIRKSLILVSKRKSDGRVKTCMIHDQLRNLCLKISEEENFLKWMGNDKHSIYETSHRIVESRHPRLQGTFGSYVRSFLYHDDLGDLEASFYCANMKLVRVLDFMYYPPCRWIGVEYLVNLRYLVIPGDLLSSIGKLVFLEYLYVVDGKKIPYFLIVKMDNLRYLCFTGYWGASFDEDCNPSQTNNLQVLSGVHIRNLKDEEMLKCSPHLRKLKCYCDPLYVEENGGYRYLDLLFFTQLESLNIELRFSPEVLETTVIFPSQINAIYICLRKACQ